MQVIYTINKMSLAIILAALSLMLLGCAYASEEAASTESIQVPSEPLNTTGAVGLSALEEMLLYENAQYGFEISYPADWTAQEADPNDEGIIVGFLAPEEDMDNPTVFLLLQNEELPAGQDVTLEQYSQAALSVFHEAMPDLEILNESDITIGMMPGYAIVYELESDDIKYRILEAWTVVGEDAYVFTYNAPVELYDQFAADAADIIDSFNVGTAAETKESSDLMQEPVATGISDELNQTEMEMAVEEEDTGVTY